MDIYVGNLTFDASEDDVREAFATFGAVESVKLIMDRETGRPRGFAFITMTDSGEANTAMATGAVAVAGATAAAVAIAAAAAAAAAKAPDAETDARRATASRKQLFETTTRFSLKRAGFSCPEDAYSSSRSTVPITSKSPVTTSPGPTKVFVLPNFPSRFVPK